MNQPGIARLAWTLFLGLLLAHGATMDGSTSNARMTDTETVASTFSSDTLDPPSTLRCTGLTACTTTFLNKPALSWTATPDSYATGYEIWRSTTSGSGYTQIGSVTPRTTTTFTDTTVAALTTYYYVVRAAATNWVSPFTNEVQVIVLV